MTEVGHGKSSTSVADLVDTNVLVYRFDPRDRKKQRVARNLLRRSVEEGSARIAHQALLEFVVAVTRPLRSDPPLLSREEAVREADELFHQFDVLYPNEALFRTTLRGALAYQLSWFDAHMWAYAEFYGLERLVSEDFQHGRLYGTVRAWNPFVG